jgi:DNA repair exonuclease SbcCD ATPase subunit
MRPLRLYIENFICYENAYINFTEFSSALIVGKKENNDMYSNGVGKTTIFKAIEYVLFNQSDSPLEKIIRDETNSCQVVFDFMIEDQEYRLSRSRTKKGTTDLTLFVRNAKDGDMAEVYHNSNEKPYISKKETEKFWKDISGSRASDTEKNLAKLIKLNHKAFISTALFPQNDMSGLPTATPEKRKAILKEGLDLVIYAKLEKIAKDRASNISKEIDRNKLLIENIGDPTSELLLLSKQLFDVDELLKDKNLSLKDAIKDQELVSAKISDLTSLHSNLESKFTSLLSQEKVLQSEKIKLETSVKEYSSKKSNATKAAKELIDEINSLKKQQSLLVAVDYLEIDIATEKINSIKDEISQLNLTIKNSIEEYEDLKIPLPTGSKCKNCRKEMSDKDRETHKKHIAVEMVNLQNLIKDSKEKIVTLNKEVFQHTLNVNSLNLSKQQLESINTKITSKNKEIQDKKAFHDEYVVLLDKFQSELKSKIDELAIVQEQLKSSSLEEASIIKTKIEDEKKIFDIIVSKISELNKQINHYNSNKAVLQHTIEQKTKDNLKKEELTKSLKKLEKEISIYPYVIQGFSSTGIPNLIIQNILDDLQIEANNLLSQLKPGLQLSFFVEKTVEKTGDQADTLGINYHINGKDRYYKQLSGAMQLAVAFSLKLGLSFLLQKTIGTDIRFLLLDEIDQSLDKASVDAFADIVKFFQKDFTILIITHNDRLKDKFSHAILVEQDINMVSRAKVVSSW